MSKSFRKSYELFLNYEPCCIDVDVDGDGMAGMWYLSKHFLSSDNRSLSIHKNEKNHKNSTHYKIKLNIIFVFFFLCWILKFLQPGASGCCCGEGGNVFF